MTRAVSVSEERTRAEEAVGYGRVGVSKCELQVLWGYRCQPTRGGRAWKDRERQDDSTAEVCRVPDDVQQSEGDAAVLRED